LALWNDLVQQIVKGKITVFPKLGDVWVPIDIGIKNYCAQFYKPDVDNKIKEGDRVLKMAYASG
jgi:hypothetical protein